MKKIINGKRYDTGTAEVVGCVGYGKPGDFDFWRETLYRKITGEFFLHCEGGPRSRYGRQVSQNWYSGGEVICPLTLEEAKAWGEEYLDADEYDQVFGRIEEGKSQIAAWVFDSLKREADVLRGKGYTVADIFEAGVRHLTK